MDFESLSYDAFEGNMPLNPDPPEMPVDAEEAQQRRDVLPWVLERSYRTDILGCLCGEGGGTDLPDNRVDGGKKWTWYASRYMTEGDSEQKRGLVKKVYETSSHKEYSLTDRGRAVYKTWMRLRELPEVDQLVGEQKGVRDEGDAVLYLLKEHYSNNDIRSSMFPTDEY
jgi:hypothetical protein